MKVPWWPHRVTPFDRTIRILDRRGSGLFRYSAGDPSHYIFTADVYAYRNRDHPARHLGWWRFLLPEGTGVAGINLDFRSIGPESVWLTQAGKRLNPIDSWSNPDYEFDPLADLDFVFRDLKARIRVLEPMLIKFLDRDILRKFYERQYASEGYTAPQDAPFLWELHAYKLRRLQKLFRQLFPPGGRVLDVGCGRSLFTEIDEKFPFKVVAGDLNYASVRTRAGEAPHQSWSVFDAAALPFKDEQFDALFAGEVIEHVPDARQTLREWTRVLKPGGIAIITTPNRERLLARVDGIERPYSPDHLSELSYRELRGELLAENGLEFVTQSNLHLEVCIANAFRNGRLDDFLQARGNKRRYTWAMKGLFPVGRLFPSVAMAMIVVARKRLARAA